MEEAAKKATSFAQHQGDDCYQPSSKEPPLYKESIPHTSQQQVIIDKLIADNYEECEDCQLRW